ncbi:MAG TPA: peptidoglycan DD-metalloendopeptidase family protein [Cellvibrio sp.]|jgi:septal ring factor EnvC (AmiA/AmiB activator)|nr:peptidoglycan DD-metalloendopeptidase family protein [Cellvibrio sp.]
MSRYSSISILFNFRVYAVALMCFLASASLADQQEDMKALQENIQQLQKELKSIQGERSELQKNLQKSETEVGELLKKIEQINRDLKQQNNQLKELQQERETLQGAKRSQQSEVAAQVASAYQLGQQSQIKLLLNQESPERVSRLLKYHQYFLAARAEKLAAYQATLEQLDELEPRIAAKTLELDKSQKALQARHQELKQRQQDRQQALARINSTLKDKDQELRQMEEDRKRLQALLQQVTHTVGSVPLPDGNEKFSSRKGRLPWPTDGKVIHRFGSPRVSGQMQWSGMMIRAAEGKPVIAVHHGRVVFADYFRGHGLLLIVDHGEGFLSLYAHNQSLFKTTGDWVRAGDAIASVGNSGGQAETALYFEIRQNGKPTDPATWLARA